MQDNRTCKQRTRIPLYHAIVTCADHVICLSYTNLCFLHHNAFGNGRDSVPFDVFHLFVATLVHSKPFTELTFTA